MCDVEPFGSCLFTGSDAIEDLPLGAIVAVCRLVACQEMTPPLIRLVPEPERSFGNYEPGRFMWMLEDIRKLSLPFPMRGQQGLFDVELPDGIL